VDPKNPEVLIVRLLSNQPKDGFCVLPIRPFHTEVNLSALVQASQVPLNDKAVYTIRTEGFEFETQLPGAQLNRFN
jgi:hypothetical protein